MNHELMELGAAAKSLADYIMEYMNEADPKIVATLTDIVRERFELFKQAKGI